MNTMKMETPDEIVACGAQMLADMCKYGPRSEDTFDVPYDPSPLRPLSPILPKEPYTPYQLVKDTLQTLFEQTRSNCEFDAYAKSFLTTAHLLAGGYPDTKFVPELDTRHSKISIKRIERGEVNIHFELEYARPLSRKRESWHQFFMRKAYDAAERSTCASGRRVGAVYVRDKAALVTSFNGVPSGYDHPEVCPRIAAGCASGEGLDMCPCNHAEMNGLAIASREGISLKDAVLYCTSKPCHGCMGILANIGLRAIVYQDDYPHPKAQEIADKAKLPVYHITEVEHYD